MDQGRILADGSLQTLLNSFASGEIIDFELEQPIREEDLSGLPGVISRQWLQPGIKGRFTVESITEVVPVMLALLQAKGIEIREFECRKKTLDDLFVALTGRSLQA
jgi:ABC-2 type transport system ATP-binding protein